MSEITYLTINGNDLSSHMQYKDYECNQVVEYSAWQDCNYTEHRTIKRRRIEGKFDLVFFSTQTETLEWFNTLMESVEDDGRYTISVYVQNIKSLEEIEAYVEWETSEQFTVGSLVGDIITLKIKEV